MAKSNHIKIGVLVLALSLVCAGVIMLSSTFANGVNYNTPAQPTFAPGSEPYNIDLNSYNKQGLTANIIEKGVKNAAANFTEGMFWCPGRTEIIYLELINHEAFPTSNTLSLNITENDFSNVLTYAIMPGMKAGDSLPANWQLFVDNVNKYSQNVSYALTGALDNGSYLLTDKLSLASHETAYLAVAIHMAETAGNEYQSEQNNEKNMNLQFLLQTDANYLPGTPDISNVTPQ